MSAGNALINPRLFQGLQVLFRLAPVRWLAGAGMLALAAANTALRREFQALECHCWILRVSGTPPLQWFSRRPVQRRIERALHSDRNDFREAFLRDRGATAAVTRRYTAAGGGPNDLFRDLIVLKTATADEKGVILLKYTITFRAVAALLDLDRVMNRYTLVLEPSWAGYCDTSLLMLLKRDHPVLVQCFTEADFQFVERVGFPFIPLRMGPADWVDAKVLADISSSAKSHDLVMVANWGVHKRQGTLFEALRDWRGRPLKLLLIGFPWRGRTAEDVRQEASRMGNPLVSVEIRESLPHVEVAKAVAACRVFVFLSRKEGDNKALVEAMLLNVPAIVYRDSIGGATSRVNAQTGVLASDEQLLERIEYMLAHASQFSPRSWALENTGAGLSTERLDQALRVACARSSQRYSVGIVEKVNAPNLQYKHVDDRHSFDADYQFVLGCRRPQYLHIHAAESAKALPS